jgi:hypothetical protein
VLEKEAQRIDSYLFLRTFLAGYKLTIADYAIWYHLKSKQQKYEIGIHLMFLYR